MQLSKTLTLRQKELLQVGIGDRDRYAGSVVEEEVKEHGKGSGKM